MAFSANPLLTVRLPAWRSKLLLFVLFCSFLSLIGRAVYLQGGVNTEFLQRQGEARYARTLDVPATRGRMTDRHGVVLASSVPAKAIWAIPEDVEVTPEQTRELARLLDMPATELKRRLSNEDKSFVYLRRQVDSDVADRIAAMKLAGIHDTREFKRHYPDGPASAHIVGFTNVEDRGQEGMELAQEKQLAGRTGSRRVIKDRLGRVVEDAWLRQPLDGRDLSLSIDSRIQYIAHTALKAAVDKHNAKAGAVVVADTRTGEILALANWPTYDPNVRGRFSPELTRNRVLTDTFEPGSTLKAFSIAAALDAGKIRPDTKIQTAPGRLTIGSASIGDAHPHGILTVEEVLAKSSNVGTAKIALELPAQTLWDTYTQVGFGQAPQIGFPGAVAGRMRPARTWRPIEQATISYGHGISVSLIQLARAYTVFARDGDVIPLTLMKT
ncbi:MAG: penicillin-binding protein 2, partial [Burkholderiaceae bacterium]